MTGWERVLFWVGVVLIADGVVAVLMRRRLSRLLPGFDIPIIALLEIILGLGTLLYVY